MAWYADESPIDFSGDLVRADLRAIGWLERGKPYAQGEVARAFYEKLREIARSPWQPAVAGGTHVCDLCQFEPEARDGNNLFIPNGKVIFVAPVLVVHYINAHRYAPPEVFRDAVMACPETRSMEYKRLLLASGWRGVPSNR